MTKKRDDVSCIALQLESIASDSRRQARERLKDIQSRDDLALGEQEVTRLLRQEACEYLSDADEFARLAHRLRIRAPYYR